MTKKEKRERKKKDRGIVDFMMVTNHFFHDLKNWILEMNDPRNPSYITYTQADLTYMGIHAASIPCGKWKKILIQKTALKYWVSCPATRSLTKCLIMTH